MSYRIHQHAGPETAHMQCAECYGFDECHNGDKCSMIKPFPIQDGGTIPWWLAEKAYAFYHEQWPGQSLERLAERGGFGVRELICFLRRDLTMRDYGPPTIDTLRRQETTR